MTNSFMDNKINIGIFDSGVGGLWILKQLREKMPEYNYIFFGDQVHVPYGSRSLEEIQKFSEEITKFLIGKDCRLIVVACNTASAASLKYLRKKFPEILFVGMEPAVKPAVENSLTGKIGILATPATFQGELYNSVVERFAQGSELFQNTCSGLVEQIEKGELDSRETKKILEEALIPMLGPARKSYASSVAGGENIDTVVLGCTHYPFVIPIIKEIVGENVRVIDPTPAIVRQVGKILDENELIPGTEEEPARNAFIIADAGGGKTQIFTSGNAEELEKLIPRLLGEKFKIQKINLN